MKKEEFILSGLLEQYAIRATTAEETLLVEEFLIQYPDLKNELYELEEALEDYARESAQTPGIQVKNRLMNKLFAPENQQYPIDKVIPAVAKTTSVSFYKIAAAAMLVLAIGSAILAFYFYHQNKNNREQLVVTQQSLEEQRKINESLTGDLNIVTDKNVHSVILKGTPQAPEATAKIFWMKETGQVYVDSRDLPAPPPGRQYQLWAIVDGAPVDAGMIVTEKGNYTIQQMKSFGKAQAFAITLEKEGGSATPTMSEMVAISESKEL